MKSKIDNYKKFLPFLYSNLLTFSELLSLERRIKDPKMRMRIYKALFKYPDSLHDFLTEIIDNKIKVDGILPKDIK